MAGKNVNFRSLLEALDGASVDDIKTLKDLLGTVVDDAAAEEAKQTNPCDHGHEWSRKRVNAFGRTVGTSCTRCGVLAAITGHAHGEMHADEVDTQVEAERDDVVASTATAKVSKKRRAS